MTDRIRIVNELGARLHQAARASIAQGALYDPGENISRDAEGAWKGVAESLVSLIEISVRDAGKAKDIDTLKKGP